MISPMTVPCKALHSGVVHGHGDGGGGNDRGMHGDGGRGSVGGGGGGAGQVPTEDEGFSSDDKSQSTEATQDSGFCEDGDNPDLLTLIDKFQLHGGGKVVVRSKL